MDPGGQILHIIPLRHYLLWILTGIHGIAFGMRPFLRSTAGATDAGVNSFVNSCMGPMSEAGLDCPCSRIGGKCRDPLSVCDLTHHCKCDGRIGYLATSGTVCLAYPTPNTTTTPCPITTCPAVTCTAATCPAVTCPTTTTTTTVPTTTTTVPTTTTTTPTTTTIAPPVVTCRKSPGGWSVLSTAINQIPNCGKCVTVPESGSGTIECPDFSAYDAAATYSVFCHYAVLGPAGKKLKFTIQDQDAANFSFPGGTPAGGDTCQNSNLFIDGTTYCNDRPIPTAGITIDSSVTSVSFLTFVPSTATKCKITVVAI